jgi:hypothetical protein
MCVCMYVACRRRRRGGSTKRCRMPTGSRNLHPRARPVGEAGVGAAQHGLRRLRVVVVEVEGGGQGQSRAPRIRGLLLGEGVVVWLLASLNRREGGRGGGGGGESLIKDLKGTWKKTTKRLNHCSFEGGLSPPNVNPKAIMVNIGSKWSPPPLAPPEADTVRAGDGGGAGLSGLAGLGGLKRKCCMRHFSHLSRFQFVFLHTARQPLGV